MSFHRNFLDVDNRIMERNLRFVENDFEDSHNQYFGGSGNRRNSTNGSPPRDSEVVEPRAGGFHAHIESNGLEKRREFLLQLGLARHEAYELAKNTTFDIHYLEQKCHEYFVRGCRQDEVNSRILYNIRKNYAMNTTRREQEVSRNSSSGQFISRSYNEDDGREYKDRENRSQSRSHCYAPLRHDQSKERYHHQAERSLSPNGTFGTIHTRNDEYFSQQFTKTHDRRNEHVRLSRSRSPNRRTDLMPLLRNEIIKVHVRSSRSRSPTRDINVMPLLRADCPLRGDYYYSERLRSPKREVIERRFDRYNNNTKTGAAMGIASSQQSPSHHYSLPRNVRVEERYYSRSRSRSPHKALSSLPEKRYERFYAHHDDNFRDSNRARSRSFSPPRNNRGNEMYKSSDLKYQQGRNNSQNLSKQQNIPSLLSLDVFPNKRQNPKIDSQNRSIPSLLSLEVFPNRNKLQQPTRSNIKLNQLIENNSNVNNEQPVLKKNIANVPRIKCGLSNPSLGHLKANPREYWSQWWPHYKYIEYSIPKLNPNDYEIKNRIKFLLKSGSIEYRQRSQMLLKKAVKAIMKTEDIDETNYYVRDIFKLFQYKKHLEDPNFQNSLTPEELNCIAPALRQFQKKSTMTFLHQALIVRWHISLDIIKRVQAGEPLLSNYAKILLSEKSFHYLVMESIQELKKLCQQDWAHFNEFYKSIKAKRVDIYSFGVGPGLKVKTNKK